MTDDCQLLARYAADGSEEAFAELTRRHMGLVYSAALRQVRNDQAARDITQVVFTNLARRARSLPSGTILAGWLHRDTRYTAIDFIRTEVRRARREQQHVDMNTPHESADAAWQEIRPLLDEAFSKLSPSDRDALLLRFFEQRDFAGVGAALGASAEAARKRVDRALDQLRLYFVKRGITTTAAALSGALAAHGIETIPAGFAAAHVASSATAAATKAGCLSTLMIMNKTKLAFTAFVVTGALSVPLIFQQRAIAAARAEQSFLQAKMQLPAESPPKIPTSDTTARDRADLERLRRESKSLNAQMDELATKAQKLASQSTSKPGGKYVGKAVRISTARDVGATTPVDAMQTFLWAFGQGDTNRMVHLLFIEPTDDPNDTTNTESKLMNQFAKESDSMHKAEGGKGADLEIQFLEEQPADGNDQWVITASSGNDELKRILMRLTGEGWKWVVNTNGKPAEETIAER